MAPSLASGAGEQIRALAIQAGRFAGLRANALGMVRVSPAGFDLHGSVSYFAMVFGAASPSRQLENATKETDRQALFCTKSDMALKSLKQESFMTNPPVIRELVPELTALEEDFVEAFVETGDANMAAERAGYGQPKVQGRAIARRPRVMAAIRIMTAKRLQSLAPVAINTLVKVMGDGNAPAGARVDAAKTILDRAGYVPGKGGSGENGTDVPLNEMSVSDLERLVATLEAQRAAQATDITPHSDTLSRADDAQVIDPLE